MSIYNDNITLSPEERRVLYYWQQGDTMTDAYKKVMMTICDDTRPVSPTALKKRVIRFFGTFRMRIAMAETPGVRGRQAKKDLERWKKSLSSKALKQFSKLRKTSKCSKNEEQDEQSEIEETPVPELETDNSEDVCLDEEPDVHTTAHTTAPTTDSQITESIPENNLTETEDVSEEIEDEVEDFEHPKKETKKSDFKKKKTPVKSDKDKWLDSLNVNENPSSMTIYGTGQFLAYMAVKEIMARQAEIKINHISPLDKNGSALTPTIISALKTAAAMLLPFAPAPTAEDRREMSKAAVLLGLVSDNIQESPDDYTAPIPNAIEVFDDE